MTLPHWATQAFRSTRRSLRLLQRACADIISGRRGRLVGPGGARAEHGYEPRICYVQPVPNSAGVSEKRHNIRLAAECIEARIVRPGDIFSFWHLIGAPSPTRGFQAGRSIVDGTLVRDTGGGLCQLAGMLHVVAIRAGLRVLESHAHSRDLYDETTRYAPLGSDAAVAFAYKDLRFENTLDHPLTWQIDVAPTQIRVTLRSPGPIDEFKAEFVRHDAQLQRLAATYRRCPQSGERELLRIARYRR